MHFQPIEESPEDVYLSQVVGGPRVEIEADLGRMDDVFGSASASPADQDAQTGVHPSDIHRLQTEHATAGYREGITAAKESSVQAGFDEGFSLGATVGSRAGQLLGLVEGIADALKGQTSEAAEAAEAAGKLLSEATEELTAANIFSAEYWAPDGNWKYEVTATTKDDILFADVANAHPLICKWTKIVDEQISLWHLETSLLDDETSLRLDQVPTEPPLNTAAPARGKQSLDW